MKVRGINGTSMNKDMTSSIPGSVDLNEADNLLESLHPEFHPIHLMKSCIPIKSHYFVPIPNQTKTEP